MTLQSETAATHATLAARGTLFRKRAKALLTHLAEWIETCGRYYGAAATYEELSRLSDAELARRGLSRDSLHRALREDL
jgi:hypothetical protein